MNLPKNLSLRDRFLIAPLIGVILTLILYFTSNSIIRSHSELFQHLGESNLPQVSEINRVTVLLIKNHTQLTALLISALEHMDEERVYLEGKILLNSMHELENQFSLSFFSEHMIITNQANIFEQVKQAFRQYREASASAVELSTVDTKQAQKELLAANRALNQLNELLLIVSKHFVQNLTDESALIHDSLGDHNIVTALTIALVIAMIFFAVYFSRHLSSGLEQVNQAMIRLSSGNTDIKLPERTDAYLQQLTVAVFKFKQTLVENEEQQDNLRCTLDELMDSEERYQSLLDLTPTAIITIDDTQKIVLFNKAAEQIFGYDSHEMIGQSLDKLIPEKNRHQHKNQVKSFETSDVDSISAIKRNPVAALRKNGETLFIEASISKIKRATGTLITAAITDVTERLQAEEKIQHQANFDSLTDLPNRFLSLDRLSQLLSEAQRNNEKVAVLFLDLDDFKKINDTLGHETGDELLIEAAKRLYSVIRSGDTVGRLGGDEFIVLLGGLPNAADAQPIAENLLNRFRDAFRINGRELILTASIGIAVFPEDGNRASELLRNADSAMYHSKEQGRNTYSYFTDAMNLDVSRRLALEEQIHGALDRDEFSVFYQPQIDISSGRIMGAEALLRWHNPALGDVSPKEFIPIAEQTGLILPLGQFVLNEALGKTAQWQQDLDAKFSIAINLSPRQFRDPELVSFIDKTMQQFHISGDSLELEITEGVLMSGHGYIDTALAALNNLGVSIAMDDFGTGYSSLSYLRRYPFDVLKIDQSFVRDIAVDPADRELIHATVAMAHSLKLKVVAEGVETEEQLAFLKKLGCDYAQGYLFSKPVTAECMTGILESGIG